MSVSMKNIWSSYLQVDLNIGGLAEQSFPKTTAFHPLTSPPPYLETCIPLTETFTSLKVQSPQDKRKWFQSCFSAPSVRASAATGCGRLVHVVFLLVSKAPFYIGHFLLVLLQLMICLSSMIGENVRFLKVQSKG